MLREASDLLPVGPHLGGASVADCIVNAAVADVDRGHGVPRRTNRGFWEDSAGVADPMPAPGRSPGEGTSGMPRVAIGNEHKEPLQP